VKYNWTLRRISAVESVLRVNLERQSGISSPLFVSKPMHLRCRKRTLKLGSSRTLEYPSTKTVHCSLTDIRNTALEKSTGDEIVMNTPVLSRTCQGY
jgi:hypothetical protein